MAKNMNKKPAEKQTMAVAVEEAQKPPTEEELKARAMAAMNARSEACLAEIKASLEKYNCNIATLPRIQSGTVVADWGVQALE